MAFPSCAQGHRLSATRYFLPVLLLLAALAGGCVVEPGASGTFEKSLKVDGPVLFEISNGAGDIEIVAGPDAHVQIHGDFRVATFLFARTQPRAQDIRENPPIEQRGNVITVGLDSQRLHHVTINYRITVPHATLLRARSGSGNIEVRGLKGPVWLGAGSGDITAEKIGDDLEASTGSGNIRLNTVAAPVVASAGSGDMALDNIRGPIRARTGSGNVTLSQPGDRAQATTGSGNVRVSDAASDLRISTGSGDLTISGNPAAQSYWELRASSGDIHINVPESAGFRLYARTTSGALETNIPLTIEDKNRKSLRARAGTGDARIDAQTSSGNIRIR